MSRIGWPCLALFGLLLAIQLSATNATALLTHAISVVFSLWSMFATFHLMGYINCQYHQEFDLEPESLRPSLHRPFDRDREPSDKVAVQVQNGDLDGARQARGPCPARTDRQQLH